MKPFRNWSLRTKLTVLVACASSAGLLAAFLAIMVNTARTFAPQAREALSTQAASLSFHASTAMVFLDELDAAHTLTSLHMNRDIVAAALYTPTGVAPFASYRRKNAPAAALPDLPGPDGDRFIGRHLVLVAPVMHEGERVGTLYLLSDLRVLYRQVFTYIGVMAMLLVGGIVVAILTSAVLSRAIAGQVKELARVAENVTQRNDYTLRAVKQTDDEIGVLIDAFNEMMERILQRDTDLQRIQSDLEVRVRERTAELESINSSLSDEVAARKAAEAQLILARDRAEAANRAKSTFLANMSHDLRTPLTAVIGYSEMLQEEARDRGETRSLEDLSRIHLAANHLLSLVSDLLDLSRIEVGRMELQTEKVDLAHFVTEFAATSRPLCDINRNRFILDCAPRIGDMVTDRTRLRQVLFNLISNAAKFTRNGEVKLRAERQQHNGTGRIRFIVTDNGIGMSQQQMAHIFEPFTQADPSIALRFGGSGLGLAICRRCCDLMGGSIEVVSEPSVGTTFTVSFPTKLEDVSVN